MDKNDVLSEGEKAAAGVVYDGSCLVTKPDTNLPYIPTWPAPQGWQCPVCGSVYAPTWPSCSKCNRDPSAKFRIKDADTNWTIHTFSSHVAKDGTVWFDAADYVEMGDE